MKRCAQCKKWIWPWQKSNHHVAPSHVRCWKRLLKEAEEMRQIFGGEEVPDQIKAVLYVPTCRLHQRTMIVKDGMNMCPECQGWLYGVGQDQGNAEDQDEDQDLDRLKKELMLKKFHEANIEEMGDNDFRRFINSLHEDEVQDEADPIFIPHQIWIDEDDKEE